MTDKMFQKKLERMQQRGERYKKEKEITDAYAEYLPDRKKRKVSNIMLTVIVAAIILYTVASFWLQYMTGAPVDATLTTLWFSFWTVEVIALTAIKTSKVKHEVHDDTHEGDML